jgi:hypothetical protein
MTTQGIVTVTHRERVDVDVNLATELIRSLLLIAELLVAFRREIKSTCPMFLEAGSKA